MHNSCPRSSLLCWATRLYASLHAPLLQRPCPTLLRFSDSPGFLWPRFPPVPPPPPGERAAPSTVLLLSHVLSPFPHIVTLPVSPILTKFSSGSFIPWLSCFLLPDGAKLLFYFTLKSRYNIYLFFIFPSHPHLPHTPC